MTAWCETPEDAARKLEIAWHRINRKLDERRFGIGREAASVTERRVQLSWRYRGLKKLGEAKDWAALHEYGVECYQTLQEVVKQCNELHAHNVRMDEALRSYAARQGPALDQANQEKADLERKIQDLEGHIEIIAREFKILSAKVASRTPTVSIGDQDEGEDEDEDES